MREMTDYLRFPIGLDCEAIVTLYGPVTQEGIDVLIKVLQLSKDCYPNAERPKSIDLDLSRPTTEADGVVDESVPLN